MQQGKNKKFISTIYKNKKKKVRVWILDGKIIYSEKRYLKKKRINSVQYRYMQKVKRYHSKRQLKSKQIGKVRFQKVN